MSWLKNHLRHFVLPGIHTLARHQGSRSEWGATGSSGLTAADIKPRTKQIRPSQKCKYVEAGMLYALISSVLKKGNPTREVALGLCRQIGRAKDAEFVYAIDTRGSVKSLGERYDGVEGSDVLHSMLCNSMRRLKRQMRRKGSLLLPGRDVWCWEVMARKLSVASTFDPRVSRGVAGNKKALRICIDEWKVESWDDVLFFDTGFSGSIPRAIARAEGLDEINMLLLSSADRKKQIFRTHTGSRAKALAFEYLAKYFISGRSRDDLPYQELNPLDEFIKASLLTIWLWYHISPTRLPSYGDKKILGYDAKTIKTYQKTKINTDLMGMSDFTCATSSLDPFFVTTASSDTSITYNTNWQTGTTTLDSLWGAGTTQQFLVDQMQPPPKAPQPPKTIFDHLNDEITHEIEKEVIAGLLKDAGGNPDKIPKDKIPQNMLYKEMTDLEMLPKVNNPWNKTPIPLPLHPLVLDPESMELCDANTGQSIEGQMDTDALAKFKGHQEPTEEGFGIGQYPGPPVISAQSLKNLAGANPYGPLPQVNLSIEIENGQAVKKTTFTVPIEGKKLKQTPFTA